MPTIIINSDNNYIDERTGSVIPPQPSPNYTYDGVWGAWADARTLEDVRAAKVKSISAACNAQILAGFDSAVLGAAHHYPAQPQDQSNLVASVTDSLLAVGDAEWVTPFWCADDLGVWGFRMHTAAQIQKVGQTGKASILAAMSKNEALAYQVSLATTLEQVDAIEWPAPEVA